MEQKKNKKKNKNVSDLVLAIVPEKGDQTEVIPAPPPVFSQELSPEVTSAEGDNLVLTCCIKEAKSVYWEKDGVKVSCHSN